VQRSCAASVWPIEQMSSFSPSTVIRPMRLIEAGFTGLPRCISSPAAADAPETRRARSRCRTPPADPSRRNIRRRRS
jgi:hypothetical protein